MKKWSVLALTALLSVGAIGTAFANADDIAWIERCIRDYKDDGQTRDTLKNYCTCMNGKMPSDETLSVLAWGKTHQSEEAACDKEAGWVYSN